MTVSERRPDARVHADESSARLCSQAVEQQGDGAMSVHLGAVGYPSQAQLDGFKSRVLRAKASAQRHLYLTDWHLLDVAEPRIARLLV